MKKVSIIIVNWNGGLVFEKCLKSLQKISYVSWEVIVVDNASREEEVILVRKNLKKYIPKNKSKLILLDKNFGFAEGNNQALKEVTGEYILLLNNDTEIPANLLNKLVKRMDKDTEIGALQPKIELMDNPGYLDNAGAFLNRIGLSVHWGFGEKDSAEFNTERLIFSAKGACLMTRRDLVKKIGLFDSHFGSYFEESDFCYRIWMAGYTVLYYPGVSIKHKVGFTSKQMDQIDIMLNATKNRIFSFYKNFSNIHLITILLPHLFFLIFLSLYYVMTFQKRKASMLLGAISWNVKHFKLLNTERKNIQKLRVKRDNEFFSIIMQPINFSALFNHFQKVEANLKEV